MKNYLDLLQDILDNGEVKDDRTGVGTIATFGRQLRYNLAKGFPAMTTKSLAWKACKGELLWFLEGSSDERRLAEITHGTRDGVVTIWTPNAQAPYWKNKAKFDGDLGRVYGVQWRYWQGNVTKAELASTYDTATHLIGTINVDREEIDQITNLIDGLKKDPWGRRHLITSWNPGELDEMALPPCHLLAQFYVSGDKKLSCQMYQRSVDTFLGLPFNIASYALLTHLIAQVCGFGVGELIMILGDTHIYKTHIDQVKEQLSRTPLELPTLVLNQNVTNIFDFTMDDIHLKNYQSLGQIKAEMAV